jgi:uncharacterized protein
VRLFDRIAAWFRRWRPRFVRAGRITGTITEEQVGAWLADTTKGRLAPLDPPLLFGYYPTPKDPRMGTFQVFNDKSGQWRWRLRAANRKVIAASEAYTRKYDAVRAVQAIDRALKPGYVVDIPD